jgi:sugar phosphate isomerase/epimerase
VNLHMADSNRCALGKGSLDVDTIIMALYLIGCNQEGIFVTPEPLGPSGDPFRPCMVDQTKSYLTNWYS